MSKKQFFTNAGVTLGILATVGRGRVQRRQNGANEDDLQWTRNLGHGQQGRGEQRGLFCQHPQWQNRRVPFIPGHPWDDDAVGTDARTLRVEHPGLPELPNWPSDT